MATTRRCQLQHLLLFFIMCACGREVRQETTIGIAPALQQSKPEIVTQSPNTEAPTTLSGYVSYEDNAPAIHATVVLTSLDTGSRASVVETDDHGSFNSAIPAGNYALAVATAKGFSLIEKQTVPASGIQVQLSGACHVLTGHADHFDQRTLLNFSRKSKSAGDVFTEKVHADGHFELCLPEAFYTVYMSGGTLSIPLDIHVPRESTLELKGFPDTIIRRPPEHATHLASGLSDLVADVMARNPTIIGLGEATHGTAELATLRALLTFELIRKFDVRLILLEVDAISGVALDDYVNGASIDLAKAIAALGFWVTDTHEFTQFIEDVRKYNVTALEKVHIWGIDLQDTTLPVNVLLSHAATLSISSEMQNILQSATVKRAKGLQDLSKEQRASLDSLLTRLGLPSGKSRDGLLIAVAARSLAMQIEYWNGDMLGQYRARRDAGMAHLADFLASRFAGKRACLWAHDAHVEKEATRRMMGFHLASDHSQPYYSIGFYLYGGTARAWDANAKIGVISHPIPEAPAYTMEGALMNASGPVDVAWLAIGKLPSELKQWLMTPRFVRELGAGYVDVETMMTLRSIPDSFDAIVIIRNGHDSSPTPTGIRKISK